MLVRACFFFLSEEFTMLTKLALNILSILPPYLPSSETAGFGPLNNHNTVSYRKCDINMILLSSI